ncbi:hypothetical protein H9P43_002790 [Blastocladiella emersonii ATCC 22665]|nr:hypothetical protein H9P43_002790 [Blastocladiella emersonii ATCC 22665]
MHQSPRHPMENDLVHPAQRIPLPSEPHSGWLRADLAAAAPAAAPRPAFDPRTSPARRSTTIAASHARPAASTAAKSDAALAALFAPLNLAASPACASACQAGLSQLNDVAAQSTAGTHAARAYLAACQRKREEAAERERRAREAAEAKRRAEEEAKRRAEEEARRKAAEEAKRRAEEDARRRAEEEAARKAEEERARKEQAEQARAAAEAKQRKAEQAAADKAQAEADAAQAAADAAAKAERAEAKAKAKAAKAARGTSPVPEPECMQLIEYMKKTVNPAMKEPEHKRNGIEIRKKLNTAVGQLNNTMTKLIDVIRRVDTELKTIQAQAAPMYYEYALNLLAKSFCRQAEAEMRPDVAKAFPYGHVAVLLMAHHPRFKDFLLARMYKFCPYLIPAFPRAKTEEDRKRLLRMKPNEDGEKYMERMGTLVALFAAIVQAKPLAPNIKNPIGIDHGWTWLAHVLNLPPSDLMVYLVEKCLLLAGHALLDAYGRQAQKLVDVLIREYAFQCGDNVKPPHCDPIDLAWFSGYAQGRARVQAIDQPFSQSQIPHTTMDRPLMQSPPRRPNKRAKRGKGGKVAASSDPWQALTNSDSAELITGLPDLSSTHPPAPTPPAPQPQPQSQPVRPSPSWSANVPIEALLILIALSANVLGADLSTASSLPVSTPPLASLASSAPPRTAASVRTAAASVRAYLRGMHAETHAANTPSAVRQAENLRFATLAAQWAAVVFRSPGFAGTTAAAAAGEEGAVEADADEARGVPRGVHIAHTALRHRVGDGDQAHHAGSVSVPNAHTDLLEAVAVAPAAETTGDVDVDVDEDLGPQLVAVALVTHIQLAILATTGGFAIQAATATGQTMPKVGTLTAHEAILAELLAVSDGAASWLLSTDVAVPGSDWRDLVRFSGSDLGNRISALIGNGDTEHPGFHFLTGLAGLWWNVPALSQLIEPHPGDDEPSRARREQCRRADARGLVQGTLLREPVFQQLIADITAAASESSSASLKLAMPNVGMSTFAKALDIIGRYGWATASPNQRHRLDFAIAHHAPFALLLSSGHVRTRDVVFGPRSWAVLITHHLVRGTLSRIQKALKKIPLEEYPVSSAWPVDAKVIGNVIFLAALVSAGAPQDLRVVVQFARKVVPDNEHFLGSVVVDACGFAGSEQELVQQLERQAALPQQQQPARGGHGPVVGSLAYLLAAVARGLVAPWDEIAVTLRLLAKLPAAAAAVRDRLVSTLGDPAVAIQTIAALGTAPPGIRSRLLDLITASGSAGVLISGTLEAVCAAAGGVGGGSEDGDDRERVYRHVLLALPRFEARHKTLPNGGCCREPACPVQEQRVCRHALEILLSAFRETVASPQFWTAGAAEAVKQYFLVLDRNHQQQFLSADAVAAAVGRAAATYHDHDGYDVRNEYGHAPRVVDVAAEGESKDGGAGVVGPAAPACWCDGSVRLTVAAKLCAVAPDAVRSLFAGEPVPQVVAVLVAEVDRQQQQHLHAS